MATHNLNQKGKFIDYATLTVMSIGEAFSTLLILIVLIIVIYYGIYFLFRNFWWSMILLFGCGTCIVYCVIIQMNSHFRPKLKIFEKGFQICTSPENWFLFSPRPLFEKFIPYSEIKKIYITKKHHGYGFYVELLIIKTSSGEYIVRNIDNERDVNNQDKYNLHPTNIRKIKNILHKHLMEYKESKGHTAYSVRAKPPAPSRKG